MVAPIYSAALPLSLILSLSSDRISFMMHRNRHVNVSDCSSLFRSNVIPYYILPSSAQKSEEIRRWNLIETSGVGEGEMQRRKKWLIFFSIESQG